MPLAPEQRTILARVLRWSRSNGWTPDVYPHTWHSADRRQHVRYDAMDGELVIANMTADPLRWRVSLVPVPSVEIAVNVLAAVGCIPVELSPMGQGLHASCVCDRCLLSEPTPVLPADPDDTDAFDGPASFIEAGQAFADWVGGQVTAELAADVLSKLAHDGLIVSVAYHDETCAGPAAAEPLDRLLRLVQASDR